jgi:hypothetical protein
MKLTHIRAHINVGGVPILVIFSKLTHIRAHINVGGVPILVVVFSLHMVVRLCRLRYGCRAIGR